MTRLYLALAALFFFFLHPSNAVQLSELSDTTDNRFYPNVIHTFFDGTVLVSATSTYGYDELALHPIVTVPDPPARFSETFLLARVHPNNQTMVWATALTTIETTSVGSTVDPAGNVYIVSDRHAVLGPADGAFTVIKYSFSGKRLFEVTHAPPTLPPGGEFSSPQYRTSVIEEGKGTMFYLPSGELVLPAIAFNQKLGRKLAILRLSAASGDVLGIRSFRPPKGVFGSSIEMEDFGVVKDARKNRQDTRVCFLSRGDLTGINAAKPLYVQCTGLRKKKVVTKLLEGGDVTLFHLNILAMEQDPPKNRAPSLFVTYERARDFSYSAPEGKSKATHELVLSRLDTSTLKNVDWATGRKGKLQKPLVVKLPTPRFPDFAAGTISVRHLRKSNSVAVLIATTEKFLRIKQQKKPGTGITVVGEPGAYIYPEVYWGLFFDRKQKVKTRFIEGDPRTKGDGKFQIILSDMTFSKDEKCTRMFGFLSTEFSESGPLYVLNTPNPITSKKGKC